ncbi:MAG: pilus assembly FimT family protein [Nannocystaceae bacterium]
MRKMRDAGFSLIELLVVIAIITIFASIAFVSIGENKFDSVFARYTADLRGMFIRARTLATSNQTQVSIRIDDQVAELWWVDPVLSSATYGTDVLLEDLSLAEFDNNYIGDNVGKFGANPACIYPVEVGILAPSQSVAVARGDDCLSEFTRIVYLPGGEFSLETGAIGDVVPLFGAGVTIPVIDQRSESDRIATLIQLFPGGLVRTQGGVKYDQ